MYKIGINILPLILLVILISLACQINAGGPEPPKETIPVSTQAAKTAEQIIQENMDLQKSESLVAFTLSEEQVTSYIAEKMASSENPLLTDPQVFLRDGQAEIFGTVTRGIVTANVRIAIKVNVEPADGSLSVDVIQADFGPLPVPENLREDISSVLNETLSGSLADYTTGFKVQSIFIDNGMITISGIKQ